MGREHQLDTDTFDELTSIGGRQSRLVKLGEGSTNGFAAWLGIGLALPRSDNAYPLPVFGQIGKLEEDGKATDHNAQLLLVELGNASPQFASRRGVAFAKPARDPADLLYQLETLRAGVVCDYFAK